ncbi:T9SS type A sorting domain-containing protein [Psychroserpens mesophilus]|uniref:T9SS type A sorting domain-containing protein n=1 Tax=Psychroserpens mesophilus TaxID=325473 RepID=UPI0009FF5D51|nr:T9SS type A sorting domain-containing protein [Psychroserpens mesophilus]
MKKITLLMACLFIYYAQGQIYLPQETFDSGLGAWTVSDGGAAMGDAWSSGLVGGTESLNGTNCAFVDSDANGNGTALFETLTSPVFDSSSGTVVLLEFEQFYRDLVAGVDIGSVEVWDGAAWQQVLALDATVGAFGVPDEQSIDISAFKNANMQVRFVYDDGNDWSWYWLLDNIVVREQPTCTEAVITGTSIVNDCGNDQFQIDVNVDVVGDGTLINDGTTTYALAAGSNLVGPYASGSSVSLTIEHSDVNCNFTLSDVSFTCPTLPTVDATLTINGCLDSDTFSTAFDGSAQSFYWIQLDYDGGCFELTADTEGGDFDTEIGLYDSNGFLIGNDDDGGTDALSTFTADALPAGTYYIAAGEFNMVFGADNFNVTFPGVPNDVGTLVVNVSTPSDNTVDFCNLQFPFEGTIESGQDHLVFTQVYEAGVTEPQGAQGPGIEAWIGFSETDAMSTADFTSGDWTWVVADYNTSGPANNNDEYFAEIGSARAIGTYYYVSRYSIDGGPFTYGGINPGGSDGNFWDGTNFVSGVLTVNGPANDDFANAQPIDCTTTGLTGSTADATLDEDDAPDGFGADMDAPNVWYSYDSSVEGAADVTISLCGSTYDTSILVYTGTSGNLTLVAGNDDNAAACGAGSVQSEGIFTANGTDIYYIAVEGFNFGSTGAFTLSITCEASCTPAQTNQDCASATPLLVDGSTTTQDNTCAIVNATQPDCDLFQSIADLWFTFVAPASGEVDIVTALGTATASHLAVYEGTCGALTQLDCSTAATSSSNLTGLIGGNTYYVQLWNNGSEEGTIDITLTDASLSLSSFENVNAFSYFPNPVKNVLSLKAENTIQDISVYNMLGQEVLRANPNALEATLDMNILNSGAYFVQVTINDIAQTVRVVKQ